VLQPTTLPWHALGMRAAQCAGGCILWQPCHTWSFLALWACPRTVKYGCNITETCFNRLVLVLVLLLQMEAGVAVTVALLHLHWG
jgi:hypothetical protein